MLIFVFVDLKGLQVVYYGIVANIEPLLDGYSLLQVSVLILYDAHPRSTPQHIAYKQLASELRCQFGTFLLHGSAQNRL